MATCRQVNFKYTQGRLGVAFLESCRNPCTAPWGVQQFKALGPKEIYQTFGAATPPSLIHGVMRDVQDAVATRDATASQSR